MSGYPSKRDEHVEAVHHALRTLERARTHARRAVREALAAGVPHSRLAEELRATRPADHDYAAREVLPC